MTTDDNLTNVILQIDAGPDVDAEEIDRLTRWLRSEIEDSGIEADLVKAGPAPDATKSVEAVMLGALVITTLPTAINNLLDLLRNWSSRGNNQNVKIKTRIGDQEITIEYPPTPTLNADIQRLLETALAKPGPAPATTRSGGTDINAEKVDLEGDVIGRDKKVSITVHAETGSTVYVNESTASVTRPSQAESEPSTDSIHR